MAEVNFTVEMADLKTHINFVRNGLGNSKTDLPVMLLRFEVTGSKAVIFASEKEMFTRTEMKVMRPDVPVDGAFAVLGSKLEKLIAQVAAEKVEFTAGAENLECKAGFLTVNFELFDGAPVKTMEQGVLEHLTLSGLTLPKAGLLEALTTAKSCSTENSIRPEVNHVELRTGKVLSSDGRKIMVYDHSGFNQQVTFKLPATTLSAVIDALKYVTGEHIEVVEGKSYFYFKSNNNQFTMGVRKVERSFPAIENVIADTKDTTDTISVDKNVLELMIRGVSLGLPSDEVKLIMEVNGKGNKDAFLEVSAVNSVGRRSHEKSSCGRTAETKVTIPISFKHLLDTLGVFKGDSIVDMSVSQKRSVLLVNDKTEERKVTTAIPFRTDQQVEQERKERDAQAEARKKQEKEKEVVSTTDAQTMASVDEVLAAASELE
jgi:hypothetical protein